MRGWAKFFAAPFKFLVTSSCSVISSWIAVHAAEWASIRVACPHCLSSSLILTCEKPSSIRTELSRAIKSEKTNGEVGSGSHRCNICLVGRLVNEKRAKWGANEQWWAWIQMPNWYTITAAHSHPWQWRPWEKAILPTNHIWTLLWGPAVCYDSSLILRLSSPSISWFAALLGVEGGRPIFLTLISRSHSHAIS